MTGKRIVVGATMWAFDTRVVVEEILTDGRVKIRLPLGGWLIAPQSLVSEAPERKPKSRR